MEVAEKPGAATTKEGIIFRTAKLPLSPLPQESPPSSAPHSIKPPPPQVPSFCFKRARTPSPKPLLDIEDVRAFIRSKLGPPKEGNGHIASKRVPSGIFGIGTMGSAGSDGGYVHLSSPQANEHQGQISSHRPSTHTHTEYHYHHEHAHNANAQPCHGDHCGLQKDADAQNGYARNDCVSQDGDRRPQLSNGCPLCENEGSLSRNGGSYDQYENAPHHQHAQPPYPLLDIDDVRDSIDSFLHFTGLRRHPTTSWLNKMPWHVPRAPFLAKGLEWPPESFESEEARVAYYRKARKRKPFLLGSPPLWTVTALNLAFIQLLMYNPLQKFFDFLRRLP